MPRKFLKVVFLALVATGVVMGAAAVLKAAATTGKDIPMIAFVSTDPPNKILGDSSMAYVHQGTKPGMNYLVIGQPGTSGHFVMAIYANSSRHVNILFDSLFYPPPAPNPGECIYPHFLSSPANPVDTTYFYLRTVWKCRYIPHVDPDGTQWTELIRSTTAKDATILDFTKMRMGETVGVSFEMATFRGPDNPLTPAYDESQDLYGLTSYPHGAGYVLVTAGDWDGNGVMDWTLRTIPGRLVVVEHDRTADLPQGDCFKLTSGWPCEWGSFGLPFELKIARK
jgi:hypothetical protein